jgi:hypothetical protein
MAQINFDVERAITEFIGEKLNDNTYKVPFVLGFWHEMDEYEAGNVGGSFTKEIRLSDSYETKLEKYVPCVIESYDGDILAIDDVFNATYTIPMTFQISITHSEDLLIETASAINDMKNSFRGNIYRVNAGTTEEPMWFTMTLATNALTPTGDIEFQGGERYVFASLNIDIDLSTNLVYGNQVEFYLTDKANPQTADWVRIKPLNPTTSFGLSLDKLQNFGESENFAFAQEKGVVNTFSSFFKDTDLFWGIVETAEKGVMNKVYQYKKVYKAYSGSTLSTKFEVVRKAIIPTAVINWGIGEPSSLVFTLMKTKDQADLEALAV